MTKHIVVVDPAIVKPEISAFNRMARASALPLTVHFPSLFGTQSLEHEKEAIAGVVILGSKASVNEKLPWQAELTAWLRPLWERKIPTLGICYGHQLIGFLHGARVGHAFSGKEKRVGFRKVSFEENRLLNEKGEGTLYFSHEEAVLSVPEEMTIFASSDEVKIEGLQHKTRPIWSFQTHPETTCVKEGLERTPGDLAFGHSIVDRFLIRCQSHG